MKTPEVEKIPNLNVDAHPSICPETGFLILKNAEVGRFIKRGTTGWVRTGARLIVPKGHIAVVAQRFLATNQLLAPQIFSEGTSPEVSVQMYSGTLEDLAPPFGAPMARVWLMSVDDKLEERFSKLEERFSKIEAATESTQRLLTDMQSVMAHLTKQVSKKKEDKEESKA